MSIEARWSVGVRGIYPGTQLRRRHRASWAMMRFDAQPARRLFIVRVGLLPSAQFCRKLPDTRKRTVNTDYWLLVHWKLRILAPG